MEQHNNQNQERTENVSVLNISVNSAGKPQICGNVEQKCSTIIITIIEN